MLLRLTFSRLILSGVLICACIILFLNLLSYRQRDDEADMIDDSHGYVMTNDNGDILIRIKADVKYNHEPIDLTVHDKDYEISKVQVRTYAVATTHEQDQQVLVREAGEGSYQVLFLHGQLFTSKVWEKMGTLQYLASWGYRAIAVDLPGYGNSSLPVVEEKSTAQWLTRLIRTLRLTNFVLVSPSMSGRFSIPFVIQSNSKQSLIRGFVPISPVATKNYNTADYKNVNIPTLIVHGEDDTKFQLAIDALRHIPSSEVLTITNASHACYVQQPLQFHNGLRRFLYKVYRPLYVEQFKNRVPSSPSNNASSSLTFISEQNSKDSKSRKHL